MASPTMGSAEDKEQAKPAVLRIVGPNDTKNVVLERSPFTIGRRSDNDLPMPEPNVSRFQAAITREADGHYLEDKNSKFGTFVNGTRISRHPLVPGDRITFGGTERVHLIFAPDAPSTASREVIPTASRVLPKDMSELERLSLCLQIVRKLSSGVVQDTLVTLIEATLRLTGAERGFVFLREKSGALRLAAGRDFQARELSDDSSISHSVLNRAVTSGAEFLIADTSQSEELARQRSIMAHDLRTVICIPLLQKRNVANAPIVTGALYLDSRFASGGLTTVSRDLLSTIASEAATLVENAQLAEAEQVAKRYEQELTIAANIQRQLMNVTIPDVPFGRVRGQSMPCKEIGGDFFDVVYAGGNLWVVVADVCGKGISAALLASILQGMVHAQIVSGLPIQQVTRSANEFLCEKKLRSGYATLVIARVDQDGKAELINCGHVPPVLVQGGQIRRVGGQPCLPVGLFPSAKVEVTPFVFGRGDRLLIVTDGLTEAANSKGEEFGQERFAEAVRLDDGFERLFRSVDAFRGETALEDDCTAVQLEFCRAGDRTYTLASTLASIDEAEEAAARMASQAGFDEDDTAKIALAVREATANAYLHAHAREASKKIVVDFENTGRALVVRVRDEGPGLDVSRLPNPLAPQNLLKNCGRGIFLIRSLMDEVRFRNLRPGMEITLVKNLSETGSVRNVGETEAKESAKWQ